MTVAEKAARRGGVGIKFPNNVRGDMLSPFRNFHKKKTTTTRKLLEFIISTVQRISILNRYSVYLLFFWNLALKKKRLVFKDGAMDTCLCHLSRKNFVRVRRS